MSCCSSTISKPKVSNQKGPLSVSAALANFDLNLPLTFIYGDREIGNAYHITEVKSARVSAMDCGANSESWAETRIQLLDVASANATPMALGKFLNILEKAGLSELNSTVQFELGKIGEAMAIYELGTVSPQADRIEAHLQPVGAMCKPAQKGLSTSSGANCCG
jgi:hypothetical protein